MDLAVLGTIIQIDESHIRETEPIIRQQVSAYEAGERRSFDLTIDHPESFLGLTMQAIEEISFCETSTYGELAKDFGTSAIAVGQACQRNPVPLIVPCHRVLASDGIGGYQYPGLKERLLEHEQSLDETENA